MNTLLTPRIQSITRPFLLIQQAGNLFGLDLAGVREVLPLADLLLTPLPNTARQVMGVFNLRGDILATTDFGSLIGLDPTTVTSQSRVVVLEADKALGGSERIRFGVAVSQVGGVLPISPDAIGSAADTGSELVSVLQGLYDWQGKVVLILDVGGILRSVQLSSLQA